MEMIKKGYAFLMISLLFMMGFTTTIYKSSHPIAYKRYIEVVTLFNEGPPVIVPFYFTMVMDMRISEEILRSLMSGISYNSVHADLVHEEGCQWAISQYAHLRIQIPADDGRLVLRFLQPTVRNSQSCPMDLSSSEEEFNPNQRQMILAAPPRFWGDIERKE